ncbi:hypothetical protein J25TS5_30040 [Paenibacillus faecis]|nr:hypothetical protein J25TS5_30040 [Paenibacillus faecis]
MSLNVAAAAEAGSDSALIRAAVVMTLVSDFFFIPCPIPLIHRMISPAITPKKFTYIIMDDLGFVIIFL